MDIYAMGVCAHGMTDLILKQEMAADHCGAAMCGYGKMEIVRRGGEVPYV